MQKTCHITRDVTGNFLFLHCFAIAEDLTGLFLFNPEYFVLLLYIHVVHICII